MLDNLISVINIVTAVVTLASAIAVVTPTKKDDAFLAKIKPFIDTLALNFGNAKK